ncbi:tubulin-specific chaperone A-like [Artemia franciscana]|uniref:Tubulin-specific chaperone A n=1 Tax=Artemia franciscana TaxID=6661 RepID=A0AA88IBA0_ARTSF|nr:hypothetical protein QYM36_003363 [Artemia franciscana]
MTSDISDPRIKNLKIKTGVVKRITKEKISYEKELEKEKERLQKQKDAGEDEHVLRKQEEIIQECLQMIPDSVRRLNSAVTDLHNSLDAEKDLEEIEEYQIALLSIAAAEPHLA